MPEKDSSYCQRQDARRCLVHTKRPWAEESTTTYSVFKNIAFTPHHSDRVDYHDINSDEWKVFLLSSKRGNSDTPQQQCNIDWKNQLLMEEMVSWRKLSWSWPVSGYHTNVTTWEFKLLAHSRTEAGITSVVGLTLASRNSYSCVNKLLVSIEGPECKIHIHISKC